MKLIKRKIYPLIQQYLEPNKVVVIYGPRRVGKTTVLKEFLNQTHLRYKLDSGDHIRTQEVLASSDINLIKNYAAGYELIAIDEAQKIPQVGQGLKILVDYIDQVRVLVTGSSSFELSGQIGEPLVGRKWTLKLYPISISELAQLKTPFEITESLSDYLVYGLYPEVVTASNHKRKQDYLNEILDGYLFKDILELERVKKPKLLLDLLRLIAYQVGNEVSLSELAQTLSVDFKTVKRYLNLFEKTFILYNLKPLSGNLRKEINKKSKYYFWDLGIRNAIINNFNHLDQRNDLGNLWENFLVIERLKLQEYQRIPVNNYFWRTWNGKEIDWVEERGGQYWAYEFKYSKPKKSHFSYFKAIYHQSHFQVVTKDNFWQFINPLSLTK